MHFMIIKNEAIMDMDYMSIRLKIINKSIR